jgi:two-component system LytT family response regulator
MILKAIIVDDEEHARMLLKHRLEKFHPDVEIKDLCSCAKDALISIIRHKPDILFLDIRMPDMTGLEFFEDLKELNLPIQAIITTAHSEPAYYKKAIRLGLADYLLKPIIKEELAEALENVKLRITARLHLQQVSNIVSVLKYDTKISLSTGTSKIFVRPNSIVYATSDGKYSKLYFSNDQVENVMHGIGELVGLLPVLDFIRIDRFTLVNMTYVHKVSPRLKLIIFEYNDHNVQLEVSSAGAKHLLKMMDLPLEKKSERQKKN